MPPPTPGLSPIPALFPLWNNLSFDERAQQANRFVHLDLATLDRLSPADLALVLQWFFAQHDIETLDVIERCGALDLTLYSRQYDQEEFARLYRETPPHAFDDLSEVLEGRAVSKVRLYTLAVFTEEQRKIRNEFSGFLELLDGEALVKHFKETQFLYNSPRLQARTAWPVLKRSTAPQRKPARRAPTDPAQLKAQFLSLTQSRFLSTTLLTASAATLGITFASSFITPTLNTEMIITLFGVAVITAIGLRLYTAHRRRQRFKQLWSLLNSSAEAFELGMPYIFRMLGHEVQSVERYQSRLDSQRTGSRGIVTKLKRRGQTMVAYCACPRLELTAVDIGVCEAAMEKHHTKTGCVVIRGAFSAAAIKRAKLERITLIDGQTLKAWLR